MLANKLCEFKQVIYLELAIPLPVKWEIGLNHWFSVCFTEVCNFEEDLQRYSRCLSLISFKMCFKPIGTLEWVAIAFSRGSSQLRIFLGLPHCRQTTIWATKGSNKKHLFYDIHCFKYFTCIGFILAVILWYRFCNHMRKKVQATEL